MITLAQSPDERAVLISYLASKTGTSPDRLVGAMPFEIAAVQVNGKPMGAVLYTNKRKYSIEMAWAGEAGWLTRENIRQMFAYAFEKFGCLVACASVVAGNRKAIELLERLGCRQVGVVPHLFGEERDGILYCMAFDECRWIKDGPQEMQFSVNGAAAHG